MTKNATSFRHIENGAELPPPPFFADNFIPNAEVHNAGEIWSTMMWEAYIALHKAHQGDLEFAEVNRRMSDYVVAGLMMAPPDPTYTEQRDGILAGAAAQDPDDFLTIAEAFARRGAGTCAVSPTKLDADFGGVVEDFEIRANGVLLSAGLDDSVDSCDDDGILDATETGKLSVKIRNVGVLPMVGATVTLSATGDSVVFAGGSQLAVPDLAPQAEVDLDVDISLVDDPPPLEDIVVNLALSTPQGCEAASELPLASRLNGDVALAVSAADDVDAPITPWVIAGTQENIWSRVPAEGGGYLWHGIDFGSVSDTWIESPTLDVSASDPLIITLRHAYSFEFTDDTAWDGGLIEVSTDGGMTWEDISAYVDPGYTSTINNPVNPIHMRPVFGGTSPDFPELKTLALDLGSSFSGQALKLRFRIGTDGVRQRPRLGHRRHRLRGHHQHPVQQVGRGRQLQQQPDHHRRQRQRQRHGPHADRPHPRQLRRVRLQAPPALAAPTPTTPARRSPRSRPRAVATPPGPVRLPHSARPARPPAPSPSRRESAARFWYERPTPPLAEIPAASLGAGETYRLMTDLVAPRPIAWVSSEDGQGRRNLAPFSYFQAVCSHPPMIILSIAWHSDGRMKDTLANILETREFVVSQVSEPWLAAMNATSAESRPTSPSGAPSQVPAEPATVVGPPRVAGALAHLECRLTHAIPLGSSAPGVPSATLVVAEVVHFAVASPLLRRDARGRLIPIDPAALAAVGRLGGIAYTRTTDRFELPRPETP
jgi:flavin reductase (DIM6/NTAB) family NADH-FMN oxidoreductase RutF